MGGALKMNAGCYGSYFADAFVSARGVNRAGEASDLYSETLVLAIAAVTCLTILSSPR